jgi:hypothetical protein
MAELVKRWYDEEVVVFWRSMPASISFATKRSGRSSADRSRAAEAIDDAACGLQVSMRQLRAAP